MEIHQLENENYEKSLGNDARGGSLFFDGNLNRAIEWGERIDTNGPETPRQSGTTWQAGAQAATVSQPGGAAPGRRRRFFPCHRNTLGAKHQ